MMMNLGALRRQAAVIEPVNHGPELVVVGEPPALLPWPASRPAQAAEPVTAELRTKRFSGNAVERDQYTATIAAPGRSLAAVLQALAETCSSVEEFGRSLGADDHLILNIQIRV